MSSLRRILSRWPAAPSSLLLLFPGDAAASRPAASRRAKTGPQDDHVKAAEAAVMLAAHRRAHDLDGDLSAPRTARRLHVPRLHLAGGARRGQRGPAPTDGSPPPRRSPPRHTTCCGSTSPLPARLDADLTPHGEDPGRREGRPVPPSVLPRRRDDRVPGRRRSLRHLDRLLQGAGPGVWQPAPAGDGPGLARLPQAGGRRRSGRARRHDPLDERGVRRRLQRGRATSGPPPRPPHGGPDRDRAVLPPTIGRGYRLAVCDVLDAEPLGLLPTTRMFARIDAAVLTSSSRPSG